MRGFWPFQRKGIEKVIDQLGGSIPKVKDIEMVSVFSANAAIKRLKFSD
jgi:hypothetical protein